MTQLYDHDVVVIGSGFGGSVAALRLAEKGYRVHVYEAGRRFADEDFADTSWNLRRYLWAPRLGCYGVQRIHRLPECLILGGAGVGGGSPTTPTRSTCLRSRSSATLSGPTSRTGRPSWRLTTRRPSGCSGSSRTRAGACRAGHEGHGERSRRRRLVPQDAGRRLLRRAGKRVPDPFFGGAGPDRVGCTECGNCMVGCKVGAKNTSSRTTSPWPSDVATIEPLRTVTSIRPLDPTTPSAATR